MPAPRHNVKLPPAPTSQVLDLSWDVFGEFCRALALKVAQSGYRPDLIIGIAKAGVIPGAVIAAILQADFHSMKISRKQGTELVRMRPTLISAAPPQAQGQRVLIVDEICTSGQTLRMAVNSVRNVKPAEVRTATCFVKLGRHKPDYYAIETDATVIFPWDRQVVTETGELTGNPLYDELLGR